MCFLGFPTSAPEGKENSRWLAPQACFPGPVHRHHGLLRGDTIPDSLHGGSVLRNSFHDMEALLTNLSRPSSSFPPSLLLDFLFFFLSFLFSLLFSHVHAHAHAHVSSLTYTRTCVHAFTHTVTSSAFPAFQARDRGGKTARVRRRPPSPPYSTPPHRT